VRLFTPPSKVPKPAIGAELLEPKRYGVGVKEAVKLWEISRKHDIADSQQWYRQQY
jgi:hypothetical protein